VGLPSTRWASRAHLVVPRGHLTDGTPHLTTICRESHIFEGTQRIQQLIVARWLLGKASAELK
jgi:hypothetical protein